MLRVLDAPGCSVSCCNSIPSSRDRRSKSRPSQPVPAGMDDELFKRNDLAEPNPREGLPSSLSVGSDSPKMMESRSSSIPMKSRMTLRVMRCQKDSRSSITEELALKGPVVASSPAFLATESLIVCSRPAGPGVVSARWLFTLVLLRLVSFSISSNRSLDCSILHFSILSLVSASMLATSCSSTASILLCTLDLLLWRPSPIDRFRGLKCSKCHSCS